MAEEKCLMFIRGQQKELFGSQFEGCNKTVSVLATAIHVVGVRIPADYEKSFELLIGELMMDNPSIVSSPS